MRAKMLPARLTPQKIQIDEKLFSPLRLKKINQRAMAGFTGLAWRFLDFAPARSMAPRYEPARIMVYTAASLVNFVFSSVDVRYMKTKKREPMTSTMAAWIMSPGMTPIS